MPHSEHLIVTTCYNSWRLAANEAKRLRDKYAESGSNEVLEEFEKVRQKAKKHREEYFHKLDGDCVFDGEIILLKDALILQHLKDRINNIEWSENNKRVSSITIINKDLSELGVSYFPDQLQVLFLRGITINTPQNLRFPNELQRLYLEGATINNPQNLELPNGLLVLNLNKATINNPQNLELPNGLLWLNFGGVAQNTAFKEKLKEYKIKNPGVTIIY
jgi:hypothetical protein